MYYAHERDKYTSIMGAQLIVPIKLEYCASELNFNQWREFLFCQREVTCLPV